MKAKKIKIKAVDAMVARDGYVATPISPMDIYCAVDKNKTLKGPYDMEYMGKEIEDEEDMD